MKKRWMLPVIGVCLVLAGCATGKGSFEKEETLTEDNRETETTLHPGADLSTEEEPSGPPGSGPGGSSGGTLATVEEFPETAGEKESAPTPPPEDSWAGGCRILLASDIHYLARDLTDFKESFTHDVEHGDGKVVNYVWEITDAFTDAVKEEKPDVVIISGDLTLNGEKKSHQEMAARLGEIENSGIPVIVVPGNHDINNKRAAGFVGTEKVVAAGISPEEFADIYGEFGYDEAVSRDASSLSYVYQIDDYNRAMMLDTCQYLPYSQVGGMIGENTYDWIEEQIGEAWDLGMNVIPVGHHNLLDESEIYVKDCTIEHSEQLIALLESWQVPLFVSGHLHVQHFKQAENDGIYEIVTSSLATPPCQYGLLSYGDDGSFRYRSKALDMEAWAAGQGSQDKNLLHFTSYGKQFLGDVFYNQAQDEFAKKEGFEKLSKFEKQLMAEVYAELNSACYAGKVVEAKEVSVQKPGWRLWEQYGYPSILSQYLEFIVGDGTVDYNRLEVE